MVFLLKVFCKRLSGIIACIFSCFLNADVSCFGLAFPLGNNMIEPQFIEVFIEAFFLIKIDDFRKINGIRSTQF